MILNHLKVASRSLRRNSFYSVINVCGLACGLATAILLLVWVQNERSYDQSVTAHERIHRAVVTIDNNGKDYVLDVLPGPISGLAQSLPQVEKVVRVNDDWDQVLATLDRREILDGFHTAFVDSAFFSVFDFPLLSGDQRSLFPDIQSVVLTRTTAMKLFGNDNVVGEVVSFRKKPFAVTGVLADFPSNSSLQFDALFPIGYYGKEFTSWGGNGEWKTIDEDMGNYSFKTFLKLREGADPDETVKTLQHSFLKRVRAIAASSGSDTAADLSLRLQPIGDMHLVGLDGNNARATMVGIFMAVAILILAIAAINYVNLATARAVVRMREIGIRKIVGAEKTQLFFQFMAETLVLFCLAALMAVGLIIALLPVYRLVSGSQLSFANAGWTVWKLIGLAVTGTLLASSVYPALFLSGFQPLEALRGRLLAGVGKAPLRKVLVVFQFAISSFLVIATLVIGRQMSHVREMNLGYNKDYVLTIALPDSVVDHTDVFRQDLEKEKAISGVAFSDIFDLGNHTNATADVEWPGKRVGQQVIMGYADIDQDFIPVMGLQLVEGRNFAGTPADENQYIVNEAAVKEMGWSAPYVGRAFTVHQRKGTVVGVVKDFNYQSLTTKIGPMVLKYGNRENMLYVRTSAGRVQEAISAVEKAYSRYANDVPFSYNFIDKQLEARYESDLRTGLLFNIFGGVAIFISCLGLLGLTTYGLGQRVREIGIRKTLGADTVTIVRILSAGTLARALLSFALAAPLATWMMHKWLQNFAYRIVMQWWMFAVAGAVTVLIALLTVGFLSVRAARANPVRALRNE